MKIDLRKVFMKNITYFFNQINYFWKRKATKTLGHAQELCVRASCMRTHTHAYMCMLGFRKLCKESFLHFN